MPGLLLVLQLQQQQLQQQFLDNEVVNNQDLLFGHWE
jgi:hypothetical protein